MSGTGGLGNGLATAVALAGGAGAVPQGEQPDMFCDVMEDASLPTRARSGPKGGRPKGARNRTTTEMIDYLRSRYPSPLIGLAEMWSRPPSELAKELGLYRYVQVGFGDDGKVEKVLDVAEAARLQMKARETALPYWEKKQPIALEPVGGADGLGILVFGDLNVSVGTGEGAGLPLADDDEPIAASATPIAASE
jgi:hypothetical protein